MASVNWDSLIKAAVDEGLKQVVANKNNTVTATDANKASPVVTKEVKEQLKPVIENQTNNEPWYKSRIVRGAAGVIATTAYTMFMDWYADGAILPEVLGGYVGIFVTNFYVIYGRFTAAGTPTI